MDRILREKGLTQFFYRDGLKRYIGRVSSVQNQTNVFGILDAEAETVVFITDAERGIMRSSFRFKNEEDAFEELLQLAEREQYIEWAEQTLENFSSVTPELVAYLVENYGYGPQRAEKAIAYLLQAEYIACEFVYYIKNGHFVPPHLACLFKGCTAQRLYEHTTLSVLGAFNYMVYLKTKPQEALENLRKGLPCKAFFLDSLGRFKFDTHQEEK